MDNKIKVLSQVIQEFWDNPNFKKELMGNPVNAIEKLTGSTLEIPSGIETIIVVDQSDENEIHINIPPEPILDDMELSESELEVVSGGSLSAFDKVKMAVCYAPKWEIKGGCFPPTKPSEDYSSLISGSTK